MVISAKYPGKCGVCGAAIQVGTQVEWSKGSGARHVSCPTGVPAPAPAKVRAPRVYVDPKIVGVESPMASRFEGSTNFREPDEQVGTSTWLRTGKVLLAVVVVGYYRATYLRSEEAEDMGHYGLRNGYYGTVYYRDATVAEYEALQLARFRAEGTCQAVGAALVAGVVAIASVAKAA